MKCSNCGGSHLIHVDKHVEVLETPIVDGVIQDPSEGELIDDLGQDEYIECKSCYQEFDFEVGDDMIVILLSPRED
jgi:hypothetical protein